MMMDRCAHGGKKALDRRGASPLAMTDLFSVSLTFMAMHPPEHEPALRLARFPLPALSGKRERVEKSRYAHVSREKRLSCYGLFLRPNGGGRR